MEEKLLKYKVLNNRLISPYMGFKYEIGKPYHCQDFDINRNKDCSTRFYATDIEGLLYAYRKGKVIYQCEVWGKSIIFDQFKQGFENIKIIKRVTPAFIKKEIKKQDLINKLGYDIEKALFPVNPLLIKRGKVTKQEIELLKQWAYVWASVGASVGAAA